MNKNLRDHGMCDVSGFLEFLRMERKKYDKFKRFNDRTIY